VAEREPGEGGLRSLAEGAGGNGRAPSPAPGEVEAYEQDWYRSLKALAERARELEEVEPSEGQPAAGRGDEAEHPPVEAADEAAHPPAERVDEDEGAPDRASARSEEAEPAADVPPQGSIAEVPTQSSIAEVATQGIAEVPTQGSIAEVPTQGIAEVAPAGTAEPAPGEPEPGALVEPAAPTAPAGTPAPAVQAPPPASLTSPDAAERRAALEALAVRGVSDADLGRVAALVVDPDPDVRRLSLEILAPRAADVSLGVIRQGLQDPADEVRAAAVRLAAARPVPPAEIAPLIAARRSPLAQAAALAALPPLVRDAGGVDDDALDALLRSAADLLPPLSEDERTALAELGRLLGPRRLTEALAHDDARRLGALRLLVAEGSPEALAAAAALHDDPDEAVRAVAATARDRLAEPEPPRSPAVGARDLVETVAAELAGPDAAARQRARERLRALDRAAVVEWAREALRGDDLHRAGLAAALAEAADLVEVAHDLIERALGLQAESRQPFLRALQALASARSGELEGVLGRLAPERRPEAVRLLWEAAGPSAMPLLRSALVDPTPAVRIAVLEVLRGTGEPEAVEAATTALGADSAPAVREAAVRLLADAPLARRIECLERALLDPDPGVRAAAVELLPAGGGREAAGPLLRALSDPDQAVRRAAARHVASLPDEDLPLVWSALLTASPEHREQVVAVLERTAPDRLARLAIERVAAPEPEQRLLAVGLLARAGTPEAVGAAIQALQDVRSEVRRAAAAALASLRSPEAVPALGRSLGDPDPEVRREAVRALGVIDDEAVLGLLVTALKDPDPEVRRTASEVLTEWSSPAVAKRLAEVLEHPELRGQARELLVKMGPSAVELLVDVLLQASPAVRPEIGDLLERIAGRERFVERLSSLDPDQRLRALQALAAIGGADLVPALLRALSDPDERVRILAADLLGETGDASALEPLRRTFLSDPVPEVVRAAERALARLRPRG